MKIFFFGLTGLFTTTLFFSSLSNVAFAKTVKTGNQFPKDKVQDFIGKYFPSADIPGGVKGEFKYCTGWNKGAAECVYPAMGSRSNGEEASCSVTKSGKKKTLSGSSASDFIDKYFPDAEIPGSVKGNFSYCVGLKTATADCFVPAMGGRSNGEEDYCSISGGNVKKILSDIAHEEESAKKSVEPAKPISDAPSVK